MLQRRNRQDPEQRVSLIPTVTSRELTGIWHRWILSSHLPQQKQSFLYAAEAARLRARWKREVPHSSASPTRHRQKHSTLWGGAAILHTLAPWQGAFIRARPVGSFSRCAQGKPLRRSQGRPLSLWQVALGHPASSKPQPLRVTPFRSAFSRRLKTIFFFPWDKISGIFCPLQSYDCMAVGPASSVLDSVLLRKLHFSPILGSPGNKIYTPSSSLWCKAKSLNINGFILGYISTSRGWSSLFPTQLLHGAYVLMVKKWPHQRGDESSQLSAELDVMATDPTALRTAAVTGANSWNKRGRKAACK